MKLKAADALKARAAKLRKENKCLEDAGGASEASTFGSPAGKRAVKSPLTLDPSQVSKVLRANPDDTTPACDVIKVLVRDSIRKLDVLSLKSLQARVPMPERKGKSTANKKHTTAPVPVMGDVQEEEDEEKTFFKDASDNAAAQEAA